MSLPDSDLVTQVSTSLGHRRGRYPRRREYAAIVIHVTGSGPLQRYRDGWRPSWAGLGPGASLLEIALAIYQGVTEAAPHYLVHEQEVIQLCPEGLAAWHVGGRASAQYEVRGWHQHPVDSEGRPVDVSWWLRRWPELRSPLELADGRLWGAERSANRGAIGMELLYPYDAHRTAPSSQTWATLTALVQDVAERRAIDTCVGHSDAHPVARTAEGQPWDPPPWFDRIMAAQVLGQPAWCAVPEA